MKVKTVRHFLLVLSFLTVTLIHQTYGNRFSAGASSTISIIVSGQILNDSTGGPVKNHGVIVKVAYIGYTATVYTDSSGNYTDTIHELHGPGDTVSVSTYDCHNILHVQFQPIQSYSIIVNFFICEAYSPNCIAVFIAELDSSSVTPNTYRFFDLSKGNPEHWSWEFGDGTTSAERNPLHVFVNSGQYKVCLTISRDFLEAPCTDSSCTTISTPVYFSIGGHAFAGDHPINNPVNTGDTALAYLYKLYNNHIIPADTVTFSYLGYYSFPYLLSGDYIVKIALTSGSSGTRKYAPTYYLQQIYWQQSQLLRVSDSNVFNFDVYFTRTNDSLNGGGRISGKVKRHEQTSDDFTLYRGEVLLLDSLKNLITYTLCDVSGNFSFTSIPYGNYLLYVESTGKFSKFSPVCISSLNPLVDTLNLEIYDHYVTGIDEIKRNDVVAGLPFPNPSAGKISISLAVAKPVDLITSVYSIQSETLLEYRSHFNAGANIFCADLTTLSPGIYILIIKTLEGERVSTHKLIRY